MRKALFLVSFLSLVACTTTYMPRMASTDSITANKQYKLHGWVTVQYDNQMGESSPRELLVQKAQEMYPGADDVIDVIFYSRLSVTPLSSQVQGFFAEGRVISYQ